jgi:hypothetical protein
MGGRAMKKIPLEETLVGAYRFLFTNIVSIIGTAWLPIVLLVAIQGGLLYLSVPHAWFLGHFPEFKTPQDMVTTLSPLFYLGPVYAFLALITAAMIAVGLMQHSLGLKNGTTFVYFSLGGPVWRMLGAYLLCTLILIAVVALLAAIVLLFCFLALPKLPHGPGVLAAVLLGIVAFCVYIYTAFRLFFFFPAVVVAEGSLGIGRSWELGGGNFWRIFLISLLIFIPVGFLANTILQITVMPSFLSVIVTMPHDRDPSHAARNLHTILQALWPVLPAVMGVVLAERIVILGLFSGAIGSAYKAVAAPLDKA